MTEVLLTTRTQDSVLTGVSINSEKLRYGRLKMTSKSFQGTLMQRKTTLDSASICAK